MVFDKVKGLLLLVRSLYAAPLVLGPDEGLILVGPGLPVDLFLLKSSVVGGSCSFERRKEC